MELSFSRGQVEVLLSLSPETKMIIKTIILVKKKQGKSSWNNLFTEKLLNVGLMMNDKSVYPFRFPL